MKPVRIDVRLRAPMLALALVCLVTGVLAGLTRLGWHALPSPSLAAMHGPLMISGFFGTVIALERAVALARPWAYAGPLLSGLGGGLVVAGAPAIAGQALLAAGSAVLVAAAVSVLARQRALFTLTMALGAACWLAGNVLWLAGWAVQSVVPAWLAFLVLTIAGERLELSRFLGTSAAATRAFGAVLIVVLAGAAAVPFAPRAGAIGFGAGLLALSAWLARFDIARRTVRERGLTRFVATCLLAGYAWLAAGAAIVLGAGGLFAGSASYDAGLHAIGLGFVFSMVFGHAPIILPAVARVTMRWHWSAYLPLALLHLSLLVRCAGDAAGTYAWRAAGGALGAVALLAFVASTALSIARGRHGSRAPRAALGRAS